MRRSCQKLGTALLRMVASGQNVVKIKLILIQENNRPQDLVVYTDGSVTKHRPTARPRSVH